MSSEPGQAPYPKPFTGNGLPRDSKVGAIRCPRCGEPLGEHSPECVAQAKREAQRPVKKRSRTCNRCTFDPRRPVSQKCLDCLQAKLEIVKDFTDANAMLRGERR
jgi:hypothetical protein